jgi:hypothetical protein
MTNRAEPSHFNLPGATTETFKNLGEAGEADCSDRMTGTELPDFRFSPKPRIH